MLQCSPSLPTFVHLAAFIWLNVGALTLLPFTTTRPMSALSPKETLAIYKLGGSRNFEKLAFAQRRRAFQTAFQQPHHFKLHVLTTPFGKASVD
jgi:hypothetical protein